VRWWRGNHGNYSSGFPMTCRRKPFIIDMGQNPMLPPWIVPIAAPDYQHYTGATEKSKRKQNWND